VTAGPPVLGPRALNRALLERQLLVTRAPLTVEEAVEHLVGLQSQNPGSPYLTLLNRLEGFAPDDLSRAIEDRRVVRLLLMRGTIHLVSARDALALRPTLQPVLARQLGGGLGRALAAVDLDALAEVTRTRLAAQPESPAVVAAELQEAFPGPTPDELGRAMRLLVPLVHPPPRGLWRRTGRALHTPIESWLGRPLDDPGISSDALLLRYLGAFGPATVAGAQSWSGLTKLAAPAQRLLAAGALIRFRDEDGRELLDLPDAPRPDPATPVPIRFLADFDNVLIGHADRRRIIPTEHRDKVMTVNGIGIPSVLVDGFVRAAWALKHEPRHDRATIRVTVHGRPLSRRHASAVTAEGRRVLRTLVPEAAQREVVIGP
jgi:hypothetical protein